MQYIGFFIPVFRCNWVDSHAGVEYDELGFTLVNLDKLGHKEDPYILASQAKQVFYVTDPADKKRSVVITPRSVVITPWKKDRQLIFFETSVFLTMRSKIHQHMYVMNMRKVIGLTKLLIRINLESVVKTSKVY